MRTARNEIKTDELCKQIICSIAKKYKIDPKLIVTRLMNEDDKNDMRLGALSNTALDTHVKVWIKAGMPDYAHGSTIPLAPETFLKRFTKVS